MDKQKFAFDEKNFTLLGISVIVIIIGFILISGGKSSEETGFDPKIFSSRRLLVAPIVLVFGFSLVICAILKKPQKKKEG